MVEINAAKNYMHMMGGDTAEFCSSVTAMQCIQTAWLLPKWLTLFN